MTYLTPAERAAVAELAAWVRERFGPRLRSLVLFGSRARGEGDEDSDVDVHVVVDDLTWEEGRDIAYCCGDLLTKYDIIVSALSMSTAHFELLRRLERLIVREIDRDGVPL